MIVFFDILLLDDDVCLQSPHRQRRLLLQSVVETIPGRAAISEQEILDFGRSDSQDRLEASFANAIAQRWEGLVLKGCDEPYFPIYAAGVDRSFGRWIKLKKDYIPGLGDTVDLALVGAWYNAQEAAAFEPTKQLRWTHFLVGCLLNKTAFLQSGAKPHFRVVDAIDRHCMHRNVLQLLNQLGDFHACSPEEFEGFDLEYGRNNLAAASALFKKPFIVEMMGSGFEKPSGARYFTLRFPRILKVHTDRTLEDAASYRELQLLAEDARSVPIEELSLDRAQWQKRLKTGNGLNQYIVRRSRSLSTDSGSSTESDVPGGSETTVSDHEVGQHPIPSHNYTQKVLSSNAGHGQTLSSTDNAPVVYIDEVRLPSGAVALPDESHVLAENDNLSRLRISGQKSHSIIHQGKQNILKAVDESSQPHSALTESSCSRVTNLTSTHREVRTTRKAVESSYRRNHSLGGSFEQTKFPKSPLTTIPVYMSGTQSEDGITSSNLSQFLQALGSSETRSLLRHSNPQAASRGAAFGIVLANPGESPLGQLIHKVAKGLSRSLQNVKNSFPANGRIFFLDAVILAERINPADLRFCLRNTWYSLGQKYYYACLRWNLIERSNQAGLPTETQTEHMDGNHRNVNGSQPLGLMVSFDEAEILALGEYRSFSHLTDTSNI
ncbi:uncharacterized protein N7482_003111 [Penicillium canariense]|uniref:ATP-dependent DNA ligase family profile domain-containing protein n=1 Tax=Penicillium canariense TaxID=189055 RepID=A0A9W9IGQ3_9EURO|nr:uncharacterized protein N7482_003111 [Penicillium canariense]KAJ5177234.1 hypothetical protein N7482_003111 [Penicillium canariense]